MFCLSVKGVWKGFFGFSVTRLPYTYSLLHVFSEMHV